MKIVYSEHLRHRIATRGMPYTLPRKIVLTSSERYFDKKSSYSIAIGELNLNGQRKLAIVVYDIIDQEKTKIITVQFISRSKILSHIKSKRWI